MTETDWAAQLQRRLAKDRHRPVQQPKPGGPPRRLRDVPSIELERRLFVAITELGGQARIRDLLFVLAAEHPQDHKRVTRLIDVLSRAGALRHVAGDCVAVA